jgi:polysaccharide deacetylase 2 family uncharacterized protein YibQ
MAKKAKKKNTTRRSKRRGRKPTAKKGLSGWIVGLVILTFALLIFALWLGKGSRLGDIAVPPFEEESKNDFTARVAEVEVAIYKSLHQLGVQPSQVEFRKVTHRAQQDKQWDLTELDVLLIQNQNFSQVEKLFARNLLALSNKVTWESRKKTTTQRDLLIRVENILTHRVSLFLRGKPYREKPSAETFARLAIVIDDLGYDSRLAKRFLEIEGPLSFSVLPHGSASERIARRVHKAGRELLLHLPMEPKGYPEVNPGVGALLVDMPDVQFVKTLRKNLDSIPYISGVNNHMGSRLCEHEEKMRLVMQELKDRNLFFLDSRTSSETKAYSVAQQLKIPVAERDVFLDNIQSPRAIRSQMNRLIQSARLKGMAIGIAHPHEVTLGVLKEVIPNLAGNGVELVPVSEIVQR